MCKDEEEKKLSLKERQKLYRKEQYKKAKERFKNSDYAKEKKEKERLYRKIAYQKAKNYRLKNKLKKSSSDEEESAETNTGIVQKSELTTQNDCGIMLVSSLKKHDIQNSENTSQPKKPNLKIVYSDAKKEL